MGSRPHLLLIIGINDLLAKKTGNKENKAITDPRYKPAKDLGVLDWDEVNPDLKKLQTLVPKDKHWILSPDVEKSTYGELIFWDREFFYENIIGVRVSKGIYDNDELWALASLFPDYAMQGVKVLPPRNLLENTVWENNKDMALALLKSIGLKVKESDLQFMLCWYWS